MTPALRRRPEEASPLRGARSARGALHVRAGQRHPRYVETSQQRPSGASVRPRTNTTGFAPLAAAAMALTPTVLIVCLAMAPSCVVAPRPTRSLAPDPNSTVTKKTWKPPKSSLWNRLFMKKTTPKDDDDEEADDPETPSLAHTDFRPQYGGAPEQVSVGLYFQKFHGIDFKKDTFTADLTLTLGWIDNRTKELVNGTEAITIATASAKTGIWLPDITVTNADIKGVETISSSVRIFPSGDVRMIQRLIVQVRNIFDVRFFPFDEQTLTVELASFTLMADELQLRTPNQGEFKCGVDKDIFDHAPWYYAGEAAEVIETADGQLAKSRGVFKLSVARQARIVAQNTLIPDTLLVLISWTVFFFPLLPSFSMPRVATSLIAVLSQMQLAIRSSSMLPSSRSGLTWIELFEESCQILVFSTVILNVFLEIVFHQWKENELAGTFQNELKVIYFFLCAAVLSICFCFTSGDTDLFNVAVATRGTIFCTGLAYLTLCFFRMNNKLDDTCAGEDS